MSIGSTSFRQSLNNLVQQIFHNQSVVTWSDEQEQPQHIGIWHARVKINGRIYGHGTAGTRAGAGEMAAEMAYNNLQTGAYYSPNTSSRPIDLVEVYEEAPPSPTLIIIDLVEIDEIHDICITDIPPSPLSFDIELSEEDNAADESQGISEILPQPLSFSNELATPDSP